MVKRRTEPWPRSADSDPAASALGRFRISPTFSDTVVMVRPGECDADLTESATCSGSAVEDDGGRGSGGVRREPKGDVREPEATLAPSLGQLSSKS